MGFPGGSEGKVSARNAGDLGSIPRSGRSPGEGNGTPLQYSCLENPMDGGAWWVAVHGVAKSQTRLRDFSITFHFDALEKKMATHSSVLAWRTFDFMAVVTICSDFGAQKNSQPLFPLFPPLFAMK